MEGRLFIIPFPSFLPSFIPSFLYKYRASNSSLSPPPPSPLFFPLSFLFSFSFSSSFFFFSSSILPSIYITPYYITTNYELRITNYGSMVAGRLCVCMYELPRVMGDDVMGGWGVGGVFFYCLVLCYIVGVVVTNYMYTMLLTLDHEQYTARRVVC